MVGNRRSLAFPRSFVVCGGVFWGALMLAGLSPAAEARAGVLDQVWVGGFAHDVNDGEGKESGSVDTQIELDTVRPRALRFLGAPRLNATMSINSEGQTNFISGGLTWRGRLAGRLGGSIDFGLALTDGVTEAAPGPEGDYDREHRLLLGSKVLFREAVGLDWQLSRRWSVGLQFVHLSNGGILSNGSNEGLSDLGLRVGYRFGQ